MKRILGLIGLTCVLVASAFAGDGKAQGSLFSQGRFAIRAFYGFNGGDAKDDFDIDSIFGAGLEYQMPTMFGATNGWWHLGAEFNASSEGSGDVTQDNYGIYAGIAYPIAMGEDMGNSPLSLLLNVGYFNTKYSDSDESIDDWGIGFDAGFRYRLQNFWIELFYRTRPEADGNSNNAFVIGVNFPLGGKS